MSEQGPDLNLPNVKNPWKISQEDAQTMKTALEEIAGYYNEAADPGEPGQAAARRARQALIDMGALVERRRRT